MLKYNLDNLNNLIKSTGKLIDQDPLTDSIDEVWLIKKQFLAIQEAIEDKSPEKSKWLLATIFSWWSSRDEWFQFKNFEWKINSIFSQFDVVHSGIQHTMWMYKKFSEWLATENVKLKEYLDTTVAATADESIELSHYKVMLDTLNLSLDRINLSYKSALDLDRTMEVTRPIFQAVLSSCMIEVAGQRTLDASIQMNDILKGTIESMSDKLTQNTIYTSQRALEIWTTPLLAAPKLQENILLLGKALEDIEAKKQLLLWS